jgi:hypothetical protein
MGQRNADQKGSRVNMRSSQTPGTEPAANSSVPVQVPATPAMTLGQRHGTLTLSQASRSSRASAQGPTYGAHFSSGDFSIWLEDPNLLGVVAYVLNVGTVRLSLPALPDRTPRVQAFEQRLPPEVISLTGRGGSSLLARHNAEAEAQFVRRFVASLWCCYGSDREPATVIDRYRQVLLPSALKVIPKPLQVNLTLGRSLP